MNFTELLKRKYPEVDFDRYRFSTGDIIALDDGAVVLCTSSAIEYINAYVVKRSLKYREYKQYCIPYDELPVFEDSFTPAKYKLNTTLRWKVGDIIRTLDGRMLVYLYSDQGHQTFYGWCIESENPYYTHTGIYIENPYKDYIAN